MNLPCPVSINEHREIDGFDLIAVLSLMKEFNRQEIWRRYGPTDGHRDSISMYVDGGRYFIEMHIQKMQRIILSEKFNTSPFFMQQVVQRITAGHAHELIMEKIRQQGIDTGDNPISLACSMGDTITDLLVNVNELWPAQEDPLRGKRHVERVEKRSLDVYDISSVLYLCQQNLPAAIFRRYQAPGQLGSEQPEVNFSCRTGAYQINVHFHRIVTGEVPLVSAVDNASVSSMHLVLQRINFCHADDLVLKELLDVGPTFTLERVRTEFTLRRYINNTALQLTFTRV
jgi:hypothetical protein